MSQACEDSLRRCQLLLLLFPGICVEAAEETGVVRALEDCFTQLGLFAGGAPGVLARNAVANQRGELSWVHDERLGWINGYGYSQRNPRSLRSDLKEGDFLRIKAFFDSFRARPQAES